MLRITTTTVFRRSADKGSDLVIDSGDRDVSENEVDATVKGER